jgi:hypothetical protein
MDARLDAVLYGIERGFIMANHTYSHPHAVDLSFEDICAEIEKTDNVLEKLYQRAGVKRPGKYFRFPYLDRGMGSFLVEDLPEQHRTAQEELLSSGLGHVPQKPAAALIEKKRRVQEFLKKLGYTNLPVKNVTLPWYAKTEMAQSIDSLCTYSTADWALLERHKGKHGFSTIQDLKNKIDQDAGLKDKGSSHIVLAHDQGEIYEVTTALIDHFLARNFEFLDY